MRKYKNINYYIGITAISLAILTFFVGVQHRALFASEIVTLYNTTSPALLGELSKDGTVNALDWSIMNANWWNTSYTIADINNDGIVNTIDFSIMNGEWGI